MGSCLTRDESQKEALEALILQPEGEPLGVHADEG